jgi:integrase
MLSHLKRLRDHFGCWRACSLRRIHVLAFIEILRKEGKGNATINRSTQLLSQAFKIAARSDPPKVQRELSVPKLDESGNIRKGKFSPAEAEAVAASLPLYLADVALFAYEVGSRKTELLSLKWNFIDGDVIRVPMLNTKNRQERRIAITPEMEVILARRRAARVEGCDLIFHHDGQPIVDYRKCWHTACVANGLGHFECRTCHATLDAERRCHTCGEKWERPKYVGRLFHDFRRSAAHEMWKSGTSAEDAMKVTGHKTASMFRRYADLFSEQEEREIQLAAQERRRLWRESQPKPSPGPLGHNSDTIQ